MNFIFRGNEILLCEEDMRLPDADVYTQLSLSPDALHPIGAIADSEHHCAHVGADSQPPAGYAFHKLRAVLAGMGEWASLAGRAFQVAEWIRTHRYCGVCATPMKRSESELCFHCPSCGFSAYPRVSPAMMVLIRKGDHILLASHANYATARYTALAGFVEAGENIEEAIHREVLEEVGLRVKDLRYFGSQSWPFPHSLMIAYTAEYESGDLHIQQDEIADARWYGPGDILPDIPSVESIAGRLIRAHLPPGIRVD